jgi:hypothetical protein
VADTCTLSAWDAEPVTHAVIGKVSAESDAVGSDTVETDAVGTDEAWF